MLSTLLIIIGNAIIERLEENHERGGDSKILGTHFTQELNPGDRIHKFHSIIAQSSNHSILPLMGDVEIVYQCDTNKV